MYLSILLTFISAMAFIYLIINITLLILGLEDLRMLRRGEVSVGAAIFGPFARFSREPYFKMSKLPLPLYLSCFSLIAAYYFIPMGSLPQFFTIPGGFIIVAALLLVAQSCYIRGLRAYSPELYAALDRYSVNALTKFTFTLFVVVLTLAWYMMTIGIPGRVLSMNSYAAMPLSMEVGPLGTAGLVCFFLSLAVVSPCRRICDAKLPRPSSMLEIYDAVRSSLCPAIITAMFLPCNIGLRMGLIGIPMYAADFLFFWLKAAALQLVIIPPIHSFYLKRRDRLPNGLKLSVWLAVSFAGAALLLADLYLA